MKNMKSLVAPCSVISLLLGSQIAFAQEQATVGATTPSPAAAPVTTSSTQTPAAANVAGATALPAAHSADAHVAINASPAPEAVNANAQAPVATANGPVATPAPASPDAPPPSLPTKFAIANTGYLQIGALMQGWLALEDGTAIADDPAGGKYDTTAYFRIRRAQIKVFGDVVKDAVSYFVLFDLAKTLSFSQIGSGSAITGYKPPGDTSPLLDYYITLKSKWADVTTGQWKSPISYEGYSSSAELLLPERAYTTRYFGDNYDLGIKAEKKFDYVKYSLQVLQGMPTANQRDNNRQKEVALRLEFTPMKGLMVGGAGLTSVGDRERQTTTRDIVEADVAYDDYDFIARGELLWGWYGATREGLQRTKARGMTASFGYTIAKKIQPVARLSYLDIDVTTDGKPTGQPLYSKFQFPTDEVRGYEIGVNYFLDGKYAKLQAAYGYFDMDNAPYRQQFILSGQVAF